MTECFILAAGDGHVRAYRFKKRPDGHGVFVGSLPFLRKGGDIYITTDESGILPTLPGYVEEFPPRQHGRVLDEPPVRMEDHHRSPPRRETDAQDCNN